MKKNLTSLVEYFIAFFKSLVGKIAIALFITIFILMQINACIYGSTYENYVISLVASLFELTITISFVQYALDKKKNVEDRYSETKRILQNHNVLIIYIQQYIFYYNQMTVPFGEERGRVSSNAFRKDFKISDLADLHKPTLLLKNRFQVSPVEKFFDVEKKITTLFSQILITQDFMFYPQIKDLFQEFITISLQANPSDTILDNMNIRIGEKDAKLEIDSMLKLNVDDYYEKLIAGKVSPSNLMFSYCVLFNLMQAESVIIEKYINQVNAIILFNHK